LVLVVATVFAGYRFAALVRLVDLVGFLVLAAVLVQVLSTRRRARLAGAALVATLAVLTLNGLHQHFLGLGEVQRALPEHIEKMRASGALPASAVDALIKRATTGDVFGTFITANGFAGYLVLVIPAAAAAAWMGWRRRRSAAGLGACALCGLTTLAALWVLWLTRSKGGMVAFVGALAIGAVILGIHRLRMKHVASAAGLLLATLLLLHPSSLEGKDRVSGSRSDDNTAGQASRGTSEQAPFPLGDSAEVRLQYWRGSWEIFRRHPLLGVGPGNWDEHYHRWRPPEGSETRYAHNDFIEVACETGVVGLAAYLCMWMAWFAALRRRAPAPDGDEASPRAFALALALAGAAAVVFAMAQFIPTAETAWMLVIGVATWLAVFGVQAFVILRAEDDEASARWMRRALVVGVIAFLLHSAVDFDLNAPGITRTLACALAAALGLRVVSPERRTRRLTSAGQLGLTLGAVVPVAVLLFGVLYPLTEMSIEQYRAGELREEYAEARRSAEAAVEAGKLDEADAWMTRAGKVLTGKLPATLGHAAEAWDGNAEIQLALADAEVDARRYAVAHAKLRLTIAEHRLAPMAEVARLDAAYNEALAQDLFANPYAPLEPVREHLGRAKALRPMDPAPWVRLADILVSRMRAADIAGRSGTAEETAVEALDEITQAVHRYPARPELRLKRGEILERLGRDAEAVEEYGKALDFARRTSMKELKFTPEKEAELQSRIERLKQEATKKQLNDTPPPVSSPFPRLRSGQARGAE
jgi:O-antigen ligase